MKKGWKIIAIALVCCLFTLSLVSCSGSVTREEALTATNEFLTALETEDYEKAKTLLHPDLVVDLEPAVKGIEDSLGVDFQEGVTIENHTGFRVSMNTTVMGSQYEMTMQAKIGDVLVELEVSVVRNNNGFGIYSFYVNK